MEKLKEEKRTILNLVSDKYDSLIQEAENQTEESRSKMTSLEENLILLDNIKQYVGREPLLSREVKNYQEAVNSVTEHNDHAPLQLHYVEYTGNKDKERLVEELCGEFSHKNHRKERIIQQYKQPELTRKSLGTQLKQSEKTGKLLSKRFDPSYHNICTGFEKPLAALASGSTRAKRTRNLSQIKESIILTGSPNRCSVPSSQRKLH